MVIIKFRNYSKVILFIILFLFIIVNTVNAKNANSSRHIQVALAFRKNDSYDKCTQQIIDGIYSAKSLFERNNSSYQIDLIKYNYEYHNLSSIANIANKICLSNIKIVIGAEMSEEALVLGEILNSCHIVLITPTATNPIISKNRKYVFRMSVSDEVVAKNLSRFTFDKFSSQNIGIIDSVSLPYTDFLAKSFYNNYVKISSRKPFIRKVLNEKMDYTDDISYYIKNNVKVIAMLTYDISLKRFIFQSAERNYFPVFIGSDGWGSNEYLSKVLLDNYKLCKNFVGYRNYYWGNDVNNETRKQFIYTFKSLYNYTPNAWNAIGFDSMWVALNGMISNENKSLVYKLSHLPIIELATTNKFRFNNENSPEKEVNIYKITVNGNNFVTAYKNDS